MCTFEELELIARLEEVRHLRTYIGRLEDILPMKRAGGARTDRLEACLEQLRGKLAVALAKPGPMG